MLYRKRKKSQDRARLRSQRAIAAAACALLLAATAVRTAVPAQAALSREAAFRHAQALTALGARLFRDPRLSASGRQACSSCHDPRYAYGPPDTRPVEPGGPAMTGLGFRAPPSLTYLEAVPRFTEHSFDSDEEADESIDNGPTGGLTWDGRVDTGAAQALIPLLSPVEMANRTEDEAEQRLIAAGYSKELNALRLPVSRSNTSGAPFQSRLSVALDALEAYQQDWKTFYPYNSKYDRFLAGKVRLTREEARGLALFNDPEKGNCASCHISAPAKDGTPPQLSDYGMIALAVPRNNAIPANNDPKFYDLGLCGPLRTDFRDRQDYCGLFRTPSLRNVALRKTFFHNGVMHNLRDAVAFYASRDSDPERWYGRGPHGARRYDDLPEKYWSNINTDQPFGGIGQKNPSLTDDEIDAIVAFLKTLTDNWRPDRKAPR
ncbi:c-type cytochrome [Acetobacter musti]|uniref:C-type cytochrome n=1 Tax=Acetobacter musti TaxID=864732 RepID=A0ABX0JK32_9PROT|nr:cytochrome c peroxidase [Acetobacter musti]NHN83095.1 c-type cytochrome [Acetobacter musti]